MAPSIRFNPVTILLVVGALAVGYGGWKYAPAFWQAQKVDELLRSVQWEASKINLSGADPRIESLEERVREGSIAMGIDERFLEVYFAEDLKTIHVDYRVDIRHPFGKVHSLAFTRVHEIPASGANQ